MGTLADRGPDHSNSAVKNDIEKDGVGKAGRLMRRETGSGPPRRKGTGGRPERGLNEEVQRGAARGSG